MLAVPHARLASAQEHASATREVRAQYAKPPAGLSGAPRQAHQQPVPPRAAAVGHGLDVGAFDRAIDVDPVSLTARVQGMTTYEHLVEATLAQGCMPLVVPQLKTITLGGAVTGLGIESTSFRNGLPHESVLEAESSPATASRHGDPGRRARRPLPLVPQQLRLARLRALAHHRGRAACTPYVALRHVRFHDLTAVTDAIAAIMRERRFDGEPVDFLDGVVFSATRRT